MKGTYKIILGVVIVIIIAFAVKNFYERYILRKEYLKALEEMENEYINSFYKSNFNGIITYIKEYEKNPNKYVIGVMDSAKNEKTIGKVEITNFSNVMEGDTLRKKSNSFELEISGQKGKILSLIKYE
jgi:hypothetical protein